MQLVFNIKANLYRPLSLQFVCNQGNHSVVKTTNLFKFVVHLHLYLFRIVGHGIGPNFLYTFLQSSGSTYHKCYINTMLHRLCMVLDLTSRAASSKCSAELYSFGITSKSQSKTVSYRYNGLGLYTGCVLWKVA